MSVSFCHLGFLAKSRSVCVCVTLSLSRTAFCVSSNACTQFFMHRLGSMLIYVRLTHEL
jgi:hypothetical protein